MQMIPCILVVFAALPAADEMPDSPAAGHPD